MLYTVPYIKRDMLMIENQLPLLVLDRLVAVETGKPKNDDQINRLVHKFFSPNERYTSMTLCLHPLDVYRKGLLHGPSQRSTGDKKGGREEGTTDIVRSAAELYEAGIRFGKSRTNSLRDIRFRHGVLRLPVAVVDDLTESTFRNLMAFERLHVGAGNEVTSYVFFMDNIIDSARDVSLLHSRGIIQNAVGSDKAVAKLFNGLSRDVALDPESSLDEVHRRVNEYCRQRCNMWRANLIHTYFRSPWAVLSLAAAIFLLALTIAQTVFTVLQWRQGLQGAGDVDAGGGASPAPPFIIAPSPHL